MCSDSEGGSGAVTGRPFPRYVPSPAISWTDTGGDLVLYDRVRGTYHALNASASAIWRHLGDRGSEAEIVEALAAGFLAPREAVAGDVAAFLTTGLATGLIQAR